MPFLLELFVSACIIIGAGFTLVGSVGLARLPDFYMRLHGPTKATTLGVGAILIASAIYLTTTTDHVSVHEILVTLFLFITAPISAQMMAKAAMHLEIRRVPRTRGAPWAEHAPAAVDSGSQESRTEGPQDQDRPR